MSQFFTGLEINSAPKEKSSNMLEEEVTKLFVDLERRQFARLRKVAKKTQN